MSFSYDAIIFKVYSPTPLSLMILDVYLIHWFGSYVLWMEFHPWVKVFLLFPYCFTHPLCRKSLLRFSLMVFEVQPGVAQDPNLRLDAGTNTHVHQW